MIVDCLLDTNILLYAVSRNLAHLSKKTRAIDLIENKRFGTSAQIMQEFYVNATRKADYKMPGAAALEWIEMLEEQPCIFVNASLVKTGIEISQRYSISYWDGAIIAAAEALGAPILYSEDLSDGQLYGAVQVINPFKSTVSYGGLHEAPAKAFK